MPNIFQSIKQFFLASSASVAAKVPVKKFAKGDRVRFAWQGSEIIPDSVGTVLGYIFDEITQCDRVLVFFEEENMNCNMFEWDLVHVTEEPKQWDRETI